MFKLQRQNHKPSRSGERMDFRFSNFQAIQVPKGWDRLFLSVICLETGKTTAKLSKAVVRNGSCQWSETLLESVWISQDDSSKELEECPFKLVVSMGSARSGILGEAILDMACYVNSRGSSPVSLPLQKCNHGTILQVKIHCLTPRLKIREEATRNSTSAAKDQEIDHSENITNSNDTNDLFSRSEGSRSNRVQGTFFNTIRSNQKETSYSESSSYCSIKSADSSSTRNKLSLGNDFSGGRYSPTIRTVGTSPQSNMLLDEYSVNGHRKSGKSMDRPGATSSRESFQNNRKDIDLLSLTNAGSSTNLLAAAEDTVEELQAEAKMWERNARKLMLDVDILQKEFSDQSKKQADLVMELSAAYAEHDGFRKEIAKLKSLLEDLTVQQTVAEDPKSRSGGQFLAQQELENEMKHQQELNADLALQLRRSQEANIELVSVLQELEETIEQQKVEIENLSAPQLEFANAECYIRREEDNNTDLLLQLRQLKDSEDIRHCRIQFLEKALEDKNAELEKEKILSSQCVLAIEQGFQEKLAVKEEQIAQLREKLSASLSSSRSLNMSDSEETQEIRIEEIKSLKEKIKDLERDCSELTDENLDLLIKLKEAKVIEHPTESSEAESEVISTQPGVNCQQDELNMIDIGKDVVNGFEALEYLLIVVEQLEVSFNYLKKPWHSISVHISEKCMYHFDDLVSLSKRAPKELRNWAESVARFLFEMNSIMEAKISECEGALNRIELDVLEKDTILAAVQNKMEDYSQKIKESEFSMANLEASYNNLLQEMSQKISELDLLEADNVSKKNEINYLLQQQQGSELQIADLLNEKYQLEERLEVILKESTIPSENLDDLKNELSVVRNSLDSHVLANKMLEMKSSELASEKFRVDCQLRVLEKENMELTEQHHALRSQIEEMEAAKGLLETELKNSQNLAINLRDKIQMLEMDMETKVADLNQILENIQNQLSEADKECEFLKLENGRLQSSAESLADERRNLQELNGILKIRKMEGDKHCEDIRRQLEKSQRCLSDCFKKVQVLEENLQLMMDAFSLKEKSLNSELEALLQENKIQKEQLALIESSSHQMHQEKQSEIKKLQNIVEHQTDKFSVISEENRRLARADHELSCLLAEREKLESDLQQANSNAKLFENELRSSQAESMLKIESLMAELESSERMLKSMVTDHEKTTKVLTNCRAIKEKLKTAINDLELKLTISDYECQKLQVEISSLKAELQKVPDLQSEFSKLKIELDQCRSERGNLGTALQIMSADYEELKAEKISFLENISSLQEAVSELDTCKQEKVTLQERIKQMENDLFEKERTVSQTAELRSELSEVKNMNEHYQQLIDKLEEEKQEWVKKAQTYEMNQQEEQNYRRKIEEAQIAQVDISGKVQLLEKDLANAREANNNLRNQLQRLHSVGRDDSPAAVRGSVVGGDVVPREMYERTKSSLKTELKDLRERYLHMSLKYAEVEAQREDLVMKLKAAKSGKKWV